MQVDEKLIENGARKVFIKSFESIGELVNYCETATVNTFVWKKRKSQDFENYSGKFFGTTNYNEALKLLLNGWTQGAEKLTQQLKIANASNQAKEVKKAIYDIVGFQASVPRYLQGIPTNMVNKKNVKQKQKVVTLVKACNYSGSVSANEIMQDSVKFLQIVQAIEAQGIRVNIDIISFVTSTSSKQAIFSRIPIKKASERLNISKMSFPLLHPSFLRRIMFSLRETEMRVTDNTFGWKYGQPADKQQVEEMLKPNEYFIPNLISSEDKIAHIERVENNSK